MIYKNVVEYCKENNISISAFEQKCDLSNGLVAKWEEKNYEPSISTLKKIASATEIPIEEWLKE